MFPALRTTDSHAAVLDLIAEAATAGGWIYPDVTKSTAAYARRGTGLGWGLTHQSEIVAVQVHKGRAIYAHHCVQGRRAVYINLRNTEGMITLFWTLATAQDRHEFMQPPRP